MSSQFQTFGGNPIQPAYPGGINLSLTGNISLAWPIQFQNTNDIVYNYMNITPTANGYVITLPDATLVSAWQSFIVNNPSAYSFTINNFTGGLVYTSNAGTSEYIILSDNSTQAGTWITQPFAAGGSSVTSINMTSSSNNVVIGGVPITSAGTITLALANDLLALTSFGSSQGIAARTGSNTWQLRQIVGTLNQIAVANPFGIAGNPTLSLANNITGINSITVGDINIGTNIISTLNTNEDLFLDPNGTGLVVIGGGGAEIEAGAPLYFYADNTVNYMSIEGGAQTVNYSLIWPTVAPGVGQVLQYGGINQLQWANVTTFGGPSTVSALARFSTTFGSLENSTVLLDNLGNLTDINSLVLTNIQIGGTGADLPNTISTLNADGNLYLVPNGSGEVQTNGNLTVLNNGLFKLTDGAVNYYSFQSGTPLGQNFPYTLPTSVPGLSQVWATSTAGLPATWVNTYMPSNQNILLNGGFLVWQRGTSFTNATDYPNDNLQYCADLWKILSNGNNIASVSRAAGPTGLMTAFSTYSWQFTATTANTKFGMIQIMPGSSSVGLSGGNVVLSLTATSSAALNLKFAVIGWNGAIDAPTTNPISAWNAAGTNPTLVANWAYQGTIENITLTNAFTNYTTGSIAIGAGITNLAVFIWCDSTTAAIGNTINITGVNLTKGPNFTPFYQRIFTEEIILCLRYFQKDYPYSIAPYTAATATTLGTAFVTTANTGINIGTGSIYAQVQYEVEMANIAAATVLTVYGYALTDTAVSNNTGLDLAANTGAINAQLTGSKGFVLQNTSGGNLTTTGYVLFHYTIEVNF